MKYGYMNYRKHLLPDKNNRPMNIGDPIQSFAVLELFRRIGISEDEIIALDRYDLADYDGEEVVAVVNGPESYEHFAYATRFLPVSAKIHPVFIGLHLHRDLSDAELLTLRRNQPIGCRDEYTVLYLQEKGIDAFLTGCLTMLFPERDAEKKYDKIFIVDCCDAAMEYIPDNIKENAEFLSQVIRMTSFASDYRLTIEETEEYKRIAREQLNRFREEAKLVITGRLHVASPCAAMGIPVVLVKDTFDERFQFIDRILPLYYPQELKNLDWGQIKSGISEQMKQSLTAVCKNMIDLAVLRHELAELYSVKKQEIVIAGEEEIAAEKLPMKTEERFDYCIWGVCMPNSYLLYEQMKKQYPNARLLYAIDSYATGIYKDNIRIIHPDKIDTLVDRKTWILVVAPAAHESARKKLICNYSFALIKGTSCKAFEKL